MHVRKLGYAKLRHCASLIKVKIGHCADYSATRRVESGDSTRYCEYLTVTVFDA